MFCTHKSNFGAYKVYPNNLMYFLQLKIRFFTIYIIIIHYIYFTETHKSSRFETRNKKIHHHLKAFPP